MSPILLNQAIKFIALKECRKGTPNLQTYLCPANVPTIGYGDTEWLKQNFKTKEEMLRQKITKEFADELLRKRIETDYDFLLKCFTKRNFEMLSLNNNQITALLSLVFNIGRTAFENSSLLRVIISKSNIEKIKECFLMWKYAGSKPILLSRRIEEFELYVK